LKIPEYDAIVMLTKSVNPDFVYPLEEKVLET